MLKSVRSFKVMFVAALLALLAVPVGAAPPELVEGTLHVELSADGTLTFSWQSTTASMSYIVYGTAPDAMNQQTAQYFSLDAFHEHVIEKVEASTTYYYQIVIMNWTDEQSETEVFTFETPALESVDTVSGFGAISQVNLSWEPAFGASVYRVERSETADGPYDVVGESDTTSFIDADVELGVPYYYRVITVASDGTTGEPSDVIEVVPVEGPMSGIEVIAPNLKAAYEGFHGPTASFEAVRPLEAGAPHYVDRSAGTHHIASVPEALRGAHLIATINDDKQIQSQEYFIIDIYYNTTVYVAFDPRAELDNWLPNWVREQFEKTDLKIGVHDPDGTVASNGMTLFKKEVTAGRLVLPSNMAPSNNATSYFIIILPRD